MAEPAENFFHLIKNKRKRNDEDEDSFYQTLFKRRATVGNVSAQMDKVGVAAAAAILGNVKERKERSPNKQREVEKLWWSEVYQNYTEEEFKGEMRLNRATFNFILGEVHEKLLLKPTNMKPYPTSPDRQLGLTIYRLATGCSCKTLSALFGLSIPSVDEFFNKVCRVLVSKLYDQYVFLPRNDAEWGLFFISLTMPIFFSIKLASYLCFFY